MPNENEDVNTVEGQGQGQNDNNVLPEDILSDYRNLLQRHQNDAQTTAQTLYQDNYRLREDRRQLRAQLTRLEGNLPQEGQIVVDQSAWDAYQALGTVDELTGMRDQLAQQRRSEEVSRAAKAYGYAEGVLGKLLQDKELEFIGKDDELKVFIGTGDERKELSELVTTEWADFVPALQTVPSNGTVQPPKAEGGVQIIRPAKAAGADNETSNPVNDRLAKYEERKKSQPKF